MRRVDKILKIPAFLLSGLLIAAPVCAAELLIVYKDRAPYYTTTEYGVGGLISGPVSRALELAGIATTWERLPWNRQIYTIEHNVTAVCSPGWFKNTEREAFAKFSIPIYQDKPLVVVMRTADAKKLNHDSLHGLLADHSLVFGAKLGFSYGTYVDDLIAASDTRKDVTDQTVAGMAKMLIRRRIDYMLMAAEEYSAMIDNLNNEGGELHAVTMSDMPPGNRRYLMCSKMVDDNLIQRFNDAFRAL